MSKKARVRPISPIEKIDKPLAIKIELCPECVFEIQELIQIKNTREVRAAMERES